MHVLKRFTFTILSLLVASVLVSLASLSSASAATAASAASAATPALTNGMPATSVSTVKVRPNRKAYLIQPGLFTEDPFVVVNGEQLTPARWSPLLFDLENSMKDNSAAASLARTHEIYGKASGIVLWSGMGAAAAYAAITPRDQFSPGVFWGTFGGSIAVSYGLERIANVYLQRAIRTYNLSSSSPSILPGAAQKTSDLKLNLIPLEKGAAFSFALEY